MTIRACAGDRGGGHITCDYLVFINLEEHEFLKMECLNNVIQKNNITNYLHKMLRNF
jgi:hypothetical protein